MKKTEEIEDLNQVIAQHNKDSTKSKDMLLQVIK